jgi:dynein heavy chain
MTCLNVAFYEQVGLMQDELRVLQPQLIETSEITEKLMVKIEQDTVVVEAKKEVNLLLFDLI